MKTFIGNLLFLSLTGCAVHTIPIAWRVEGVVLSPNSEIEMDGPQSDVVHEMPSRTLQYIMLLFI